MLLVIHWNVDPEIFNFHGFAPRWYSLGFLVGFMIGYYIVQKMFTEEKVNTESLDTLLLYLIVGTVMGARIGHCMFYEWDYFQHHLLEMILPVRFEPEFRFTGYTGLASHGGAIGVLIAQWLYMKFVLKKPLIWLLDRIGVPIMLVGCFIRLGNLMNSEILGSPTDVPWAFVFERVNLGRLLGVFTVLLWSARFLLEYFKTAQGGLETTLGLLSTGQWLSIPLILVGLYFMFRKVEPVS